jgi:hypothetical protein
MCRATVRCAQGISPVSARIPFHQRDIGMGLVVRGSIEDLSRRGLTVRLALRQHPTGPRSFQVYHAVHEICISSEPSMISSTVSPSQVMKRRSQGSGSILARALQSRSLRAGNGNWKRPRLRLESVNPTLGAFLVIVMCIFAEHAIPGGNRIDFLA